MPNKKISGVLLNATQYNRWLTMMNKMDFRGNMPGEDGYQRGQTLLDSLNNEIYKDDYQSEIKEDKLYRLKAIVSDAKTQARDRLLDEYPELGGGLLSPPRGQKRQRAEQIILQRTRDQP